jgi:hypothetical protein
MNGDAGVSLRSSAHMRRRRSAQTAGHDQEFVIRITIDFDL